VDLGDGDDTLIGDRVNAGATDLTVYGGQGEDVISLFGDGDDLIYGGSETDWIWAGDGDDLVEGGDGIDYLYGGAGTDTLRGQLGDDVFYVGRGDGSVTIDDDQGSNGLAFFHGWNDSANYDGVKQGEVAFSYDSLAQTVTVTLADGVDAGSAADATVVFDFGDIDILELWDKKDGTVASSPTAFNDFAVVQYLWNAATEQFDLQ
jgi:hypothetical protein